MAGDWIKWQKRLHQKPEILATARKLRLSIGDTCLCYMRFWEWADDVTATGVVEGIELADIDDIAQHPGFAQAAVSVGWLINDGGHFTLPNYSRHNGDPAKRRAMDSQRKRAQRIREASR